MLLGKRSTCHTTENLKQGHKKNLRYSIILRYGTTEKEGIPHLIT